MGENPVAIGQFHPEQPGRKRLKDLPFHVDYIFPGM